MRKNRIACSLVLLLCLFLGSCKSQSYKDAVALQDAGEYVEAIEMYSALDGYKDSAARIEFCTTEMEKLEAYNAAVEDFKSVVENLNEKNSVFDSAISVAEAIINEGESALDDTLFPALETAIAAAKAVKVDVPPIPEDTEEILDLCKELDAVSYDDALTILTVAQAALERSIEQYTLVDAPEESYIIKCLETVSGITGISAATEDNDPNEQLNKAGGYTAQVYFSYELVNQSSISGNTIIEKGTACGGSVEVYRTVEDVEKREAYLAVYDGTIFATGSHKIVGTVLVRTSDELTASQQNELEAKIIAALVGN